MKTVELFAGIGGFRMAADRCGLETVWANDLCPRACAVYRDNFRADLLREGSIDDLLDEIPQHDLLTAGFPCQPFSSAGKKQGIHEARGTLFHRIVVTLRNREPRFFVLENVKRLLTMERGFHFATVLSSLARLDYTIEWRLLNAMHFGLPQNRQRVFLVGVRSDTERTDARPTPRLATSVDLAELSAERVAKLNVRSEWSPIARHGRRFPNWGMACRGRFFGADLETFSEQSPRVLLRSILQKDAGPAFDFTTTTRRWLAQNRPVNRFVQGVQILSNQAGGARMGYTIFGTEGVAPTLTSTTSRHYERYRIGNRFRRLTNIEYARIQGFPDDHCRAMSVYDQYALYGNAVPPPMAEWVLGRLGRE